MKIHPELDHLKRLAEGMTPRLRRTLAHVLECARCRGLFTGLLETGGSPEPGQMLQWRNAKPSYRAILDRALVRLGQDGTPVVEPAVGLEVRRSEVLAQLREQLADEPAGVLVELGRCQDWQLPDLVLDRSRTRLAEDPRAAEHLAHLALVVVAGFGEEILGETLSADLSARAWIAVAAARRAGGDLPGADKGLAMARSFLERGSQDAHDAAIYLESEGELRREQKRHAEAAALLQRAAASFEEVEERAAAAGVLASLAEVRREMGSREEPVHILLKALALVDRRQEPRLEALLRQRLIVALVEADRYLEAQQLLAGSRGESDLPAGFRAWPPA